MAKWIADEQNNFPYQVLLTGYGKVSSDSYNPVFEWVDSAEAKGEYNFEYVNPHNTDALWTFTDEKTAALFKLRFHVGT